MHNQIGYQWMENHQESDNLLNNHKPLLILVDDDPIVIDSTRFLLRKRFSVLTASNRAELRSVLEHQDTTPHVALVDLGLPPVPHTPEE